MGIITYLRHRSYKGSDTFVYVKMLGKIPVTHCAAQESLGKVFQGKVETAGPSSREGGAGGRPAAPQSQPLPCVRSLPGQVRSPPPRRRPGSDSESSHGNFTSFGSKDVY